MGNCQAAEAATVVIEHPGGRVERAYWSLSASQVMAANPGHYVGLIVDTNHSPSRPPLPTLTSTSSSSSACHYSSGIRDARVKHLKLLRPDDTLLIGHVYRLVSFEDVFREFASKRHVKLSRLLAKQKEKTSRSRRGTAIGGGAAAGDRLPQSRHGGGSRAAEPHTSPAMQAKVEEEARVDAELEELVRGMMAMGSSTTTTTTTRSSTRAKVGGGAAARHGQWRPALQSIAEVGS